MKYAVIGGGNMGGALIRGMMASGIAKGNEIIISSSTPASAEKAALSLGVLSSDSNAKAVSGAGIVFLCVKPAQALSVVASLAGELAGKLLISIVAGIQSEELHRSALGATRVIRTMPNTAVRVRKGVTAIAPHSSCTSEDLDQARHVFSSVGSVLEVTEKSLDIVTAVSGSGPAFALLMLESLAQGGITGGLDPETAKIFAAGALAAAAALVLETGESPRALREQITSPSGTTTAGLGVLEESNFSSIVQQAVRAAKNRSVELSKKS
jgi:pyrroline-5-carboxylate reductase